MTLITGMTKMTEVTGMNEMTKMIKVTGMTRDTYFELRLLRRLGGLG